MLDVNKIRCGVVMDRSMFKILKEISKREERSISAIIRMLVTERINSYLEDEAQHGDIKTSI